MEGQELCALGSWSDGDDVGECGENGFVSRKILALCYLGSSRMGCGRADLRRQWEWSRRVNSVVFGSSRSLEGRGRGKPR